MKPAAWRPPERPRPSTDTPEHPKTRPQAAQPPKHPLRRHNYERVAYQNPTATWANVRHMLFTVSLVGIPTAGEILARPSANTYGSFEAAHAAAMAMAPPGWDAVNAPDLLPRRFDWSAIILTRPGRDAVLAAVVHGATFAPQEAADLLEAALLDKAEAEYAERIHRAVEDHRAAAR